MPFSLVTCVFRCSNQDKSLENFRLKTPMEQKLLICARQAMMSLSNEFPLLDFIVCSAPSLKGFSFTERAQVRGDLLQDRTLMEGKGNFNLLYIPCWIQHAIYLFGVAVSVGVGEDGPTTTW